MLPLTGRPELSPSPIELEVGRNREEDPSLIRCYSNNQGTGGGMGKQPNFLQKLFEFLALEPHPYPDIIYWAADSKQLVIARPDDLAKDVLPRLFKHDKVSSFGRQLNIYGFARVYPGRQFKDAQGNVLDASVWSHPTLHRLSTAGEIASIKRRAAPKLFRTRRLANGQVVRTRAGPDVERKFREIKEDMANERRTKHGWCEPSRSTLIHPRSPSLQPLSTGWMDRGESMVSPSNGDWASMGTPLIPVDELTNGYGHFPPSFEPHQDHEDYGYPLASISEDVPSSAGGLYLPRQPLITHQEGYYNSQDTLNPFDLPTTSESFPPSSARFYHSCPASIHTSPIQAHKVLDAVRPFPPSFSTSTHQRYTPYQLQLTQVQQPTQIAAPAAVNPFTNPQLAPPALSPITPYSLSADITPPEGLSREGSVYPEMQSWERTGIIEPRWVSPRGSAWTTPAVTPRTGSPVNGSGRGQTPGGVQMFPTSYGRGGGGMQVGGRQGGGMGPPPIPQSAPTSG